MMNFEERLKKDPYLTVYNKDFVKKKISSKQKFSQYQEFKDPISEGFKNYLEIEKSDAIKPESELCEEYLEKVKAEKPKVGKLFFDSPVDPIVVKGNQLLNGKSIYQVDYCDIEANIKKKLLERESTKYELPAGWDIPLTTYRTFFRDPMSLGRKPTDRPLVIIHPDNLGQNEEINEILKVKTGDSEYNQVIGKLGDFIKENQMFGPIVHPNHGSLAFNKK